jgi:TolB-like protein/DNA-binding CsgD family transcriptional regulator
LLSRREFAVAGHYAEGQTYKEIARDLGVSPATIRNHLASIYRKLGISNKAQLIHRLAEITGDARVAQTFAPGTPAAPALQLLDSGRLDLVSNPSVAVLPFRNIGSLERDHFCHGLTLNVHNNLTRFPDLFVSGRSSCLAVSHIADDIDEVSLNLGVQYLVRGAVRSQDDAARVTVELVDSVNGMVLWSEQFERKLTDILDLETEIANTIAGNLSIRIENAQYERRRKLTEDELSAYDWQLRGYRSLELGGPVNLCKANREFSEAIRLAPESAAAHAGLSMSYGYECDQMLTENYAHALERHAKLAEKAIALDESDSRAHYAMLCAYSLKGEFELADQHAVRAMELNPSEYHNLCSRGYTLMSLDNFEESVNCFSESLRRNPLAPNSCLLALGLMEYIRSNYAQSAIAFSRMLPDYLQKQSSLPASFGQLGYESGARSAVDEFHRYAADRPAYPSNRDNDWSGFWSKVYPHLGRNGFEHLIEGLGKAGLPTHNH